MTATPDWWATGTLFENCNCQLLCPGHISLAQRCDHERCLGYWAVLIEEGRWGEAPLDGLNVLVVGDAPRVMLDGGWIQALYIDDRADAPRREALERIFTGRAGGCWAVLSVFVETRRRTQFVPMTVQDDGRRKAIRIEGVLESEVAAVKGADKEGPAVIRNLRNQIHGPEHVLALGRTEFAHQGLRISTQDTHALYSRFSWRGP